MITRYSRRRILRDASRLALASMALKTRGFGIDTPLDCIVLGAGMAGLTAAYNLQAWGKRVLVLEGSERIGGRIQTLRNAFPAPVELGAEYIHRPPGSVPLWNYVNHFQLRTRQIPKRSGGRIFFPGLPLFDGGRRPETAALLWNAFAASDLFSKIERYRGRDLSAREWLKRYHVPLQLDGTLGENFVAMALTGHMPGGLDDLSIRGFGADRLGIQLSEPHEYQLVEGYDSLINRLAENLEVRTQCEVTKIEYGAEGVSVTINNGKTLRARTAICTFSIGMLRSNRVEFVPRLPPEKQDALEVIRPGHHSKVIIPFSRRFWRSDMSMAHLPWPERKAGRTYFRLFYGRDDLPPALTALLIGDDARRLDAMTDEDCLRAICSDLDVMFPSAGSTYTLIRRENDRPAIVRKAWMRDSWSLGGNSFISTHSARLAPPESARHVLADGRNTPGLFWAGEATALSTQPASVHGANESGIRAAREVFGALPSEVRYHP